MIITDGGFLFTLYTHLPWFWFALTVLFVLIEVFTMGLTTIWFAIGSLVTIFVSFAPISFRWQFLIFVLLSFLLLLLTRPAAVKALKKNKTKTNAESLIGKKALVVQRIAAFSKGEVKINGQIWTARTEDDSVMEIDAECTVLRIEGVTMIVAPI
jgi:membrane protein implicated in regulation of membrane protease activity